MEYRERNHSETWGQPVIQWAITRDIQPFQQPADDLGRVQRHWRCDLNVIGTGRNLSPRCKIRLKMNMCYLLHVSQIRIWNSRNPEDVSQSSGLCCVLSSDSDRTAIHELQHIPGAKAGFVICWCHCSLKLKMELVTTLAKDLPQGVLFLLQELLLSY